MMNYLWGGMILIGIVYGAFTGRMQDVTDAALVSAKEAVTLCITMVGVMSLWSGVMQIGSEAGMIQAISKKIRPLIRFLFPDIPCNHAANEYITTNFIANFLGLGWAATPAGLKAMESLAELEEERRAMEHGGRGEQINALPAQDGSRKERRIRAVPKGAASNEMCTFLILNISSLQLIPVNIIAYRSQYGSVNPTAIVGPAIAATAISTAVAVVFCKVMDRKRRV